MGSRFAAHFVKGKRYLATWTILNLVIKNCLLPSGDALKKHRKLKI